MHLARKRTAAAKVVARQPGIARKALAILSRQSDVYDTTGRGKLMNGTTAEETPQRYEPRWVGPSLRWVVWDTELGQIVAFGATGQRAADKAEALND
jgi:hypothetical protein